MHAINITYEQAYREADRYGRAAQEAASESPFCRSVDVTSGNPGG